MMEVDRTYTQEERRQPLPIGFDLDTRRETVSGSPKTDLGKHGLKRNRMNKMEEH